MEIISNEERVARTEHKCYFCNGVIKSGEKYNYQTIKGDFIYTWKSHLHCLELVTLLDMDADGDGITSDYFEEEILESLQELPTSILAKMIYDWKKSIK